MAKLEWTDATITVFTEATGTFTFNDDDIRAVYVDWGDGTNPAGTFTNQKEYANYQWYTTTEPTGAVVLTHTYTAAGTFEPVVQTINSKGYVSKYQSSAASNTEVTPYVQVYNGADVRTNWPITGSDGVATAVMRNQNRTVKSGIDNSLLTDDNDNQGKDIWLQVAPTLSNAELAYIGRLDIDIDCVLNQTVIEGNLTSGLTTLAQGGGEPVNKVLSVVVTGANLTGTVASALNILANGNDTAALSSGATVQRINKVTLKNCKYTGSATSYTENAVFNKLKVFILAKSEEDATVLLPITYVTPGAPIKVANDTLRNITLDFSQSRAKASNKSISFYRYDVGKGWFNPADKWKLDTDAGQENYFTDATKTSSSVKNIAYTYMCNPLGMTSQGTAANKAFLSGGNWSTNGSQDIREDQFVLDDYGRFYDQYHLCRVTAQPNSASTSTGSEVSTLSGSFIPTFRITPAVEWPSGSQNGAITYPGKVLDYAGSDTQIASTSSYSANFSNAARDNVSGATSITSHPVSGLTNLSGMNSMSFEEIDGITSRNANEYMLLLLPEKTNQIYLNISNYAENMQSGDPISNAPSYGVAGVSYLKIEKSGTIHQNAYWEPLEFTDNTAITKEFRNTTDKKYNQIKASLARAGTISFNTPTDWLDTDLNNLCGGNFSKTYTTTGSDDIVIDSLTTGSLSAGSTFGDYLTCTAAVLDRADMIAAFPEGGKEVGSFKYIFVCTGSDDVKDKGAAWWLSKDGADGWDGTSEMYLHIGKSGATGAPVPSGATLSGYVRRINIYDAISGFSKVYKPDSDIDKLIMVDASGTTDLEATRYPFDFTVLTSDNAEGANTVGGKIDDYWGDTGATEYSTRYALKISLSGADTSDNIYPEVWNVLNANVGNNIVIKQVDDSAYNLNSLPITSDIGVGRAGNYYQAITRKGKVFVSRVGTPIQEMSFSSVALGDESSSDAFADSGPSTLYGHLHKIRKIQANNVKVYWDQPQKDGTFVRFWGMVTAVNESYGTGGPKKVVSFDFSMLVEEIALIDDNYKLMTDIFPLGGVLNERNFS